MPNLQDEFIAFHDKIKLDAYDENKTLQDKRDMLIDELKQGLKDEKIPDTDTALTFSKFDQGSYAMHTGINPSDNDYDIDVGVVFDIRKNEYDPIKLKKLIRDKLTRANRSISIRQPCITIEYADGYHVDLAVYADNSNDYHIAWGKEYSTDPSWEKSEPKQLIEWVKNVSDDADKRLQYRRCVRYLKAWKEKHFSADGNGMPPSIGLTIQARKGFFFNEDNDLGTLISIVNYILNSFYDKYHETSGSFKKTTKIELPVAPFKNVYDKMSLVQTDIFYQKVDSLLEALEASRDEDSPHKASKILQKVFGDKLFPLVEKEEARQSNVKPVVTTGNNA